MERLRPLPTPAELAAMYAEPHNHRAYGHGHHLRVEQSKVFTQWLAGWQPISSAADLSCGNGEVLKDLFDGHRDLQPHYGDIAPGWGYEGPIEETIYQIPDVDLFICCETLEHLDHPEAVLGRIRAKAHFLLLSTPIENWNDANAEHLWAWSREDVEGMLVSAGWHVTAFASVDSRPLLEPYLYGLWVCS